MSRGELRLDRIIPIAAASVGSVSGARIGRRLARAAELRVQVLRHRGDAVQCPLCAHRFSRFRDDWNRPNVLCWRCGSHERHRAQWLLLQGRPELLRDARSLLHFAPEWALRRRLQSIGHLRYVTADLFDPDVDLRLDIGGIDLPDGSFDAVLCSHVLEHVTDDWAAIRELRRVTVDGGWCLVMVPLDLARERTYEDASIVDPEARRAAFWQADHVRLYAPDIGERLRACGFAVERVKPVAEFGPELVERCRIGEADEIWLCRAE